MRSIGERLKEWRLAAGMKQDIAAMRMDMSRTTLSAIEAGKREVLAKEIPGFVSLYVKIPGGAPRRNQWEGEQRNNDRGYGTVCGPCDR